MSIFVNGRRPSVEETDRIPIQRQVPERAQRLGEALAGVRTIPRRRDVLGSRRVIEWMPLAEKL